MKDSKNSIDKFKDLEICTICMELKKDNPKGCNKFNCPQS